MADPAAPQVVAGRYEIGDVVGKGGHGWVYRAIDRRTGSPVAVKMLNDVAARDPELIERLKREQQALAALAGTSAVGLVDLCKGPGGNLCLVMELLDGVDLETRIEQIEITGKRMTLGELLPVLAPIVETLDRAHAAGILHRDLKPANVFLMKNGSVRLLDFGLARIRSAQPLTAAGMIMGSPSYIAPEVWKGRSDGLDHRVDVYSFGVLVYRALAGRLPLAGESLQEKYVAATTGPRPSLHAFCPDLPADVDAWVRQALAIDPNARFYTLRAAWNALHSSLHLPEPAGPIGSEPLPAPGAKPAKGGIKSAWRSAADALKRIVDVIDPASSAPARLPETSHHIVTPTVHDTGPDRAASGSARAPLPPPAAPPPAAAHPARPLPPPAAPPAAKAPPLPPPAPPPAKRAPPPPPRTNQPLADAAAKTEFALPPAPSGGIFQTSGPAPTPLAAMGEPLGERSFVSHWLPQSDLSVPEVSEAEAAEDDIVGWLTGGAGAPRRETPAAEPAAPRRPAPKPPTRAELEKHGGAEPAPAVPAVAAPAAEAPAAEAPAAEAPAAEAPAASPPAPGVETKARKTKPKQQKKKTKPRAKNKKPRRKRGR